MMDSPVAKSLSRLQVEAEPSDNWESVLFYDDFA